MKHLVSKKNAKKDDNHKLLLKVAKQLEGKELFPKKIKSAIAYLKKIESFPDLER